MGQLEVHSALRVLYIEDDRAHAILTKALLKKIGQHQYETTHVATLQEGLEALEAFDFDVILLDLTLPDSSDLDTVKAVCNQAPGLPVVVFTGNEEEYTAQEALRLGAQDYLCKGKIDADRLERSIRYSLDRKYAELEKDRIESRLLQKEKLESIGRLASGVAHDIRTPSQFIKGNLSFFSKAYSKIQALLDEVNQVVDADAEENELHLRQSISDIMEKHKIDFLSQELPKAIDQSLEGIDRIDSIVNAIYQFAHPASVQKKPGDINEMIKNSIIVSHGEWKDVAEVETQLDSALPKIDCFVDVLNRTFLNLITNAADAIAEKKVVCDSEEKGVIHISSGMESDGLTICISDTGQGIPEDIRTQIFEPFFTTKEVGQGSGQGLAQAYSAIVEMHKGVISCDSEPGVGTQFMIKLPVFQPVVIENDLVGAPKSVRS